MPKYVVIAALLMSVATPALAAEYYIGQDPTTKKCKVVTEKPDGQTLVMIGTETYATKEEAKAARRGIAECPKKDASN